MQPVPAPLFLRLHRSYRIIAGCPLSRAHALRSSEEDEDEDEEAAEEEDSRGAQFHDTPPDPRLYVELLLHHCKAVRSSSSLLLVSKEAHFLLDESLYRARGVPAICKAVHSRALKFSFLFDGRLRNALVDLYSKTGNLDYSWKIMDQFQVRRDPSSWNSILSAQLRIGTPEEAIRAFRYMRCSGDPPDQFGLAIALSACARSVSLDLGKSIHCEILKRGFGSASFCEGSLVNMYTKCNQVRDGRAVFDGIDEPDTIEWTTIIAGYSHIGCSEQALELFSMMQGSGIEPDHVTLGIVLGAFMNSGRWNEALALSASMPSSLNDVAWNSIISGLAQSRSAEEALRFFLKMRVNGVKRTRATLGSVLSAIASLAALIEGVQVHCEAIKLGLDSNNVFVASSLINMYAKCYMIEDARKEFGLMCEKNMVIWNAMLAGYVQNGKHEEVLKLFFEMKVAGFHPDGFTFVSLLGASAGLEIGGLYLGRQLHAAIVKDGFGISLFVGNAIVDMYAKCQDLDNAKQQFKLLPCRDSVSWNAVLVGLVRNEEEEEAIQVFESMRSEAFVLPDEVTFSSIFSACTSLEDYEKGKQLHGLAIKYNISSNLYVGSSLMELHAKLGEIGNAEKIYLRMPSRNVVSSNALIAGYVQNNRVMEAMELLEHIHREGQKLSQVTFSCILPAISDPSELEVGRQIHCCIVKSGFLLRDISLAVEVLCMYLKCRVQDAARKLIHEVPEYDRSLIVWTSMISGHARNGYSEDAVMLFTSMCSYGVRPDEAAFASVLRACTDMAAVKLGEEIHGLILRNGFVFYQNTSSALIDLYAKCGNVRASFLVFVELGNKEDVITWNSMIVGYAKHGHAEDALRLFKEMQSRGVKPDEVTFLGVLTACSHGGLVSEGQGFFHNMLVWYGIIPRADHYACIVDLLGRSGYLREAEKLIHEMPFKPDAVVWSILLAACRTHGDELLGRRAAEQLMKLEPGKSSPYVLLSNIQAATANWGGSKMVRELMSEGGVRKSPGCSWID